TVPLPALAVVPDWSGLGGLPPRRRSPDRDAGCGRFDLARDGQECRLADRSPTADQRAGPVSIRTDAAAPDGVGQLFDPRAARRLVVSASSSVDTMFMGIMGFKPLPVLAPRPRPGDNRQRASLAAGRNTSPGRRPVAGGRSEELAIVDKSTRFLNL